MINLGMRSVAESVKGQGVGSAYAELISLLEKFGKDDMNVRINRELQKCDVIHYHTIDPVSFLMMLFSRKPSIASVHFIPETLNGAVTLPPPIFWLLNKYTILFYRNADYVHAVNPSVVGRLAEYGIKKNRIRIIPNTVSMDGFYRRDEQARRQIREKYGLGEDDFIVFGCGQVQTKKGVKSFAKTARLMPDVKFVWAGGFSFGAVSDGYLELKKLMENPPENLLFTGIIEREEVSALMGASDVFFLPSFHEQCCMAVLEAACCELPILLRNLDDYHRLYGDNYLYDINPDGFAKKLRSLRDDPAFYEQQAKKAAKLSRIYSEERIFKLWKKFYSKCAARE